MITVLVLARKNAGLQKKDDRSHGKDSTLYVIFRKSSADLSIADRP